LRVVRVAVTNVEVLPHLPEPGVVWMAELEVVDRVMWESEQRVTAVVRVLEVADEAVQGRGRSARTGKVSENWKVERELEK
jgi:hypothetical protein